MRNLHRALMRTGATLAVVVLGAAGVTPAYAAPPDAPPEGVGPAAAELSAQSQLDTLPYPVKTGLLDDGMGVWLYADTATPGNWRVSVYDGLGVEVQGMEVVQARTRQDFALADGGWVYIYLTHTITGEERFVESYDIQGSFERIAGLSRYETSAAIADDAFTRGVPVAYVANGTTFPDALSGAAAAGYLGGPVLLTARDSLPAPIMSELEWLQPQKIVVLGGTGAVSAAVMTKLDEYTTGPVQRVSGPTRFETSAAISKATFPANAPVAYIANGLNFPDALSGAAAAGMLGGPVLLTSPTALPAAITTELARLKPAKIFVLGGTGAVNAAVFTALDAYTTGPVERLSGASRFETSAAISAETFEPGVPVAFIANAYNFPDALSGAAAAGVFGAPVLLSAADRISPAVQAELERLDPARVVVLGGPGAIDRMYAGMSLRSFAQPMVQRAGGSSSSASPAGVGPAISNVKITASNLAVTVSFDYTHSGDFFTPVMVGVYPGTPAENPYGDLTTPDWGFHNEWSGWMYMPEGLVSGHASQSFRVMDDGPLTVMVFGSAECECDGGDRFLAGRDFAAVP